MAWPVATNVTLQVRNFIQHKRGELTSYMEGYLRFLDGRVLSFVVDFVGILSQWKR